MMMMMMVVTTIRTTPMITIVFSMECMGPSTQQLPSQHSRKLDGSSDPGHSKYSCKTFHLTTLVFLQSLSLPLPLYSAPCHSAQYQTVGRGKLLWGQCWTIQRVGWWQSGGGQGWTFLYRIETNRQLLVTA